MTDYIISRDIASGTLDSDKLILEIVAANCVSGVPDITSVGGALRISGVEVTDQEVLDAVIHDHVAVSLADKKVTKVLAVDKRTRAIIAGGFAFDGQRFSLSQQAQTNWLGLAALHSAFTWPMGITTNDDTSYSLELENLSAFIGSASAVIATAVGTGRALKISINTSTTQEELDAVVDSR